MTVFKRVFDDRDWGAIETVMIGGQFHSRVTCVQCGAVESLKLDRRFPPTFVRKKLRQRGWVASARPTCPSCSPKSSMKPKSNEGEDMTKPATVTPIKAPPPPPAKTESNARNKRLVIAALEDYFDEAERRYRDGKSDATIATELDLAEQFVASVRVEFFGELAPPTEYAVLMREIEDLREKQADLARLQKSADEAITALTAALDRVALRNGWKK